MSIDTVQRQLEGRLQERRQVAGQQLAEEEELASVDRQLKEAQQVRLQVLEEVRQQVREVKAMKYNPPHIVRRSIEAVYTILECRRWADKPVQELTAMNLDKEWPRIQRTLSNDAFVSNVLSFDVSTLDSAPHVAEFVVKKYFPQLLEELETVISEHSRNQALKLSGSSEASEDRGPGSSNELVSSQAKSTSKFRPRASAGGSTGKLDAAVKAMLKNQSGSKPMEKDDRPRATAKRSSAQICRPIDVAAEPLILADVRYASQACDVFVRWAIEVLREFFNSSRLRRNREVVRDRLATILALAQSLEQECASLEAELREQSEHRQDEISEEQRTQQKLLPRPRPDAVSSGSDLVNVGSSFRAFAESSARLARTCEHRSNSASGGSTPSRLHAAIRHVRLRDLSNASPAQTRQTNESNSPERLRKPAVGVARVFSSPELSQRRLSGNAVESIVADRFSEPAAGMAKVAFNSSALPNLVSGTANMSSSMDQASSQGKDVASALNSVEQMSNSAYCTSTSMANVISSAEQLSNIAAGAAKVLGSVEPLPNITSDSNKGDLTNLAGSTAKALSSTEPSSNLATGLNRVPSIAKQSTNVASEAEHKSNPAIPMGKHQSLKERETPKWAAAFSDMCFISGHL